MTYRIYMSFQDWTTQIKIYSNAQVNKAFSLNFVKIKFDSYSFEVSQLSLLYIKGNDTSPIA